MGQDALSFVVLKMCLTILLLSPFPYLRNCKFFNDLGTRKILIKKLLQFYVVTVIYEYAFERKLNPDFLLIVYFRSTLGEINETQNSHKIGWNGELITSSSHDIWQEWNWVNTLSTFCQFCNIIICFSFLTKAIDTSFPSLLF